MSNASTTSSVQKKINKTQIKELVFGKRNENNISFDVVSGGNNPKDSSLGHLCLMGHVASEGADDVNYLVSLLGSLAKREYYSKDSLKSGDPRLAFEKTLTKLNEVLENFFASDKLDISVGLIAIANGNLMTSKLGKFKVSLARDGEYIDVINNIDLFKKDSSNSLQFSNIISGPVNKDDKVFAFIPVKPITSREKALRTAFLQTDQDQFYAKLSQIAEANESFNCCGVHMQITESKEIHKEILDNISKIEDSIHLDNNSYKSSTLTDSLVYHTPNISLASTNNAQKDINIDDESDIISKQIINQETKSHNSQIIELDSNYPSMIPTAVTYSSKNSGAVSTIAKAILFTKNLIPSVNLPFNIKINPKLILIPVIVAIAFGAYYLFPNEESVAIKNGTEKIKEINSLIDSGDLSNARSLLTSTIASIESYESDKSNSLKSSLKDLYDKSEKRDASIPQLYRDFSEQLTQDKVVKFALDGEDSVILTDQSSVAISQPSSLKEIGNIKHNPDNWILADSKIVSLEKGIALRILGLKDKVSINDSNELSSAISSPVIFGKNIYALSNNKIVKIDNAVGGGFKISNWSKEDIGSQISSIAIDGSIYALSTSESKIKVFFKGNKTSEFKLPFEIAGDSTIHTTEDGSKLFIVSPTSKILYVFDKSSGQLIKSSSFENIDSVSQIQLGKDESLYILDNNNKLYKL